MPEEGNKLVTLDGLKTVYDSIDERVSNLKSAIDEKFSVYASSLPAEYEQQLYLESSKAQRVTITGIEFMPTTRVVCDFSFLDPSANEYAFGVRQSKTRQAFDFMVYGGYFGAEYGSQRFESNIAGDTNKHMLDFNKNVVTLDSEAFVTFEPEEFEPVGNAATLFCLRTATTRYYAACRIYSAQIYQDDALVANLVPCIRKNDSIPGFYDTLNNIFFPSANETADDPYLSGCAITAVENASRIDDLKAACDDLGDMVQENTNALAAINDKYLIPQYVTTEADRVSDKVRKVQTGKTLTFIACSDLHYSVYNEPSDDVTVESSHKALTDMKNGILSIAKQVHLDFFACFGDVIYQWQGHGANYENGVAEMIGVTKLLSEAFGNNPQVRMVGNHDPNCENNQNKEFNAYLMYSFSGIYSDLLVREEDDVNGFSYGGYGYHDFDRQKIRLIVLNTSIYSEGTDLPNNNTRYSFGTRQGLWLCKTMDISDKADSADWQIIICSHVGIDGEYSAIDTYSAIINAYISGGTWYRDSTYNYNFAGKNTAKLVLYLNGHQHNYRVRNVDYVVRPDSSTRNTTPTAMANMYIPNALPGRDYESMDGVTYVKEINTATSTSFQVITINPETQTVYAHHYGAGIDFVFHYAPTTETLFETELSDPVWDSVDAGIATVSSGVVSPIAEGYTVIWAKSEADNCIEAWNYHAVII